MPHIAIITAGAISHRIRAGLSALILAAAVPAALPAGATGQSYTPIAVVELFTSQGCSSSPAADALLTEMASDGDIIALSLPVTYWDYLGWTDTRASQANTSRQFSYAARREDRAVFTPQLIVNGRTPVVGSDAEAVRAAITEQSGSGLAPSVPVDIQHLGGLFKVDIGAGTGSRTATVWIGAVEPSVAVSVARGENAGRRLSYSNIVRVLQPIGVWRGEPLSIELPADKIDRSGTGSAVVIVQTDVDGRPGEILGAALLRPPEG